MDVDGAAGIRLATEHLIARGHRRIGALAWPADSRVGNDRLEGYLAAHRSAGLSPEPGLIARGQGTADFARQAAAQWLARDEARRPTAVVAFNDTMAVGAMQASLARGLAVGPDLAVVGFDDSPLAQYASPPLTSVRQPIREVGRKCVEMLVALLEGITLSVRHALLMPELIVRESSLAASGLPAAR